MSPFPKPRGFWDYALFALFMTGLLLVLFWIDATDGVGWADALLAVAAAVLFVLEVILVRRGEKAKWIAQPTWRVHLLAALESLVLVFGAVYADAYLLHRKDITPDRLRHAMVPVIVAVTMALWTSLRRRHLGRQSS
jgi:hypothetical protein